MVNTNTEAAPINPPALRAAYTTPRGEVVRVYTRPWHDSAPCEHCDEEVSRHEVHYEHRGTNQPVHAACIEAYVAALNERENELDASTEVHIVECQTETDLLRVYPREQQAQRSYLYLNPASARAWCDHDPNTDNSKPISVHTGRVVRWLLPSGPITGEAANDLMRQMRPHLRAIVRGYTRDGDQGTYTDHADAHIDAINDHIDQHGDEYATVTWHLADDAFASVYGASWDTQIAALRITEETTDEDLDQMELAFDEGCDAPVFGTSRHLRALRAAARSR